MNGIAGFLLFLAFFSSQLIFSLVAPF